MKTSNTSSSNSRTLYISL